MDIRHRLAPLGARSRAGLRVAQLLLLAAACGAAHGAGVKEVEPLDAEIAEPVPIIVNLATDADPEAIAAARTRVLDRLREALTAEALEAVVTYGNFPAIALSATGDVIVLLLEMPEVASIERDREFAPEDDAPSTFG